MIWVLALEPGREGTWITAANYDPICFIAKTLVRTLDEGSDISKCLLGCEILQVVCAPIIEGL